MTSPDPPTTRSGWPIIALGVTSFIPGLGFILGSIAVTWGLLSDRRRAWAGVAIGATGALLHVVAGFALYSWYSRSPEMQRAQSMMVTQDLRSLVTELDAYRAKHGAYPAALQELIAKPDLLHPVNIFDHGNGAFSIKPYQYRPAPDLQHYDLFSVGRDGVPGTDDDVRPVVPDSLQGRTGFLPPH